ncbi:ABC-transporter [Parasponia andersonii]|uniref:ABC-transporter n=1 Tax=Parasponia andersonii TaxID=3476 RepID=A0A2P5CED0_PARAD|nr:ABC-transporter [Parasponia andersonii]
MVALPLASLLLIVPIWLYGSSLVDLSGKIRDAYNTAGTLAEQAISSIRTVYAFVGEKKTVAIFSSALNASAKLRLRQGLIKGLAIGSNAMIGHVRWRVRGRTTFAVGSSVIIRGRFCDPLNGEIILDGVAIDKLQLKWLRSLMALVSQEPSLFSTTIKENILFGMNDATIEDNFEASNASDAHNFISQLP